MSNKNNVIDLERALLGAILVDESLFHNITGRLEPADFSDDKNAILFETISNVYGKGFEDIELPPIINELKRTNNFEKIGGEQFLAELMQQPALSSNVQKYMEEIYLAADHRRFKGKVEALKAKLEKEGVAGSEAAREQFENEALSAARGTSIKEFTNAKDGVANAIKDLERTASGDVAKGVAVDLPSLDEKTGGFQKGDLIILAARPSMGKTALALNMAANAARTKNVAFFSLEMPIAQLYNRIISFTAFVDGNKFRNSKNLTDNE